MDQPEKRRRDMGSIRNKTHAQAGCFENSPNNIVMTIQITRAAIAKVSKSSSSRFDRPAQNFCRGVRVAQADFEALCDSQPDGFQCSWPLRRKGEQERIAAGDGSQF